MASQTRSRASAQEHEQKCKVRLLPIHQFASTGAVVGPKDAKLIAVMPCTARAVARAVRYLHKIRRGEGPAKLPPDQSPAAAWGGRGFALALAHRMQYVNSVSVLATEVPFECFLALSAITGNAVNTVVSAGLCGMLQKYGVDPRKEQIVFTKDALLLLVSKERLCTQGLTALGIK